MLAVGPGDDRAVGELEGHEGTGPDRAGPTGVDGPEEPLASGSRGGSLGYGEGAVGGVVDTVEGGAQPRESIYCLYIYILFREEKQDIFTRFIGIMFRRNIQDVMSLT